MIFEMLKILFAVSETPHPWIPAELRFGGGGTRTRARAVRDDGLGAVELRRRAQPVLQPAAG